MLRKTQNSKWRVQWKTHPDSTSRQEITTPSLRLRPPQKPSRTTNLTYANNQQLHMNLTRPLSGKCLMATSVGCVVTSTWSVGVYLANRVLSEAPPGPSRPPRPAWTEGRKEGRTPRVRTYDQHSQDESYWQLLWQDRFPKRRRKWPRGSKNDIIW